MKKKILLVEDSPYDADFLLRALDACGYSNPTIHAKDGEEALEILESHPNAHEQIGMIFLDLKMPKVDGFEVLKILKASPRFESIPVVIVSSSILDSDRTRATLLGASNFISKPIDPAEFIRLVYLALKPFRGLLHSDGASSYSA